MRRTRPIELVVFPDDSRAVLVVWRPALENNDAADFEAGCKRLLESAQPHLVLDLRQVARLPSICVGSTVKAHVMAKLAEQRFTVLAGDELAEIMKQIVGSGILDIAPDLTAGG
jgi:anti-anti-sigma regulatory factor